MAKATENKRYEVEEVVHWYVKDNETGQYLFDGADAQQADDLTAQLNEENAIRVSNAEKLAAGEPLVVDLEDSIELGDKH